MTHSTVQARKMMDGDVHLFEFSKVNLRVIVFTAICK